MFCKNCGQEVPEGINVCPRCGQLVSETEQSPAAQPYQPNDSQPGSVSDGKGQSIAALVLGIIGVVFCWIPYGNLIVLVCAILGIVFGFKGRQASIAVHGKASGLATAGFVLGIIGASICGIGVLSCTVCVSCVGLTTLGAL